MTNDPFAFDEDDRTVVRPGGAGMGEARPAGAMPAGPAREVPLLGGINPLERAASRLLPLLISIKNTAHHPDPAQLRNKLIRELEEFKRNARDVLNDQKKVTQASYVMCTALDEAAMNTPWGHEANWAQHNLLVKFHDEVIGGENFFKLLKGLGKNPAENIDVLELMYVCLALGYEGMYRIRRNGQTTLPKIRTWLYDLILTVRNNPETTLAYHWQGSDIQERKLPRLTPLWVGLAGAIALGSLVYFNLLIKLGAKSDEVATRFLAVKAEPLTVREIRRPVPQPEDPEPEIPTLTQQLGSEIASGDLSVFEDDDSGRIRLVGDNLFGSGRSAVNADTQPLLARIGSVLNTYTGRIVVTGYTDNIPIKTAKFPSNLALSKARAESVEAELSLHLEDQARLSAEGKGGADNIADNSTKEGRRKNRRVEITLFY